MAETRSNYLSRRARERRAFVSAYKLHHGCADCGYKDHPDALELDHTEPRTHKGPAVNPQWGWKRILEELDRCDVVCANCHRKRTAERRQVEQGLLDD